jgi:ketosteroid isomerase-like protein
MQHDLSADQQAIQDAVREINEHWRARRYDRIGALLAEEVVIAPPGFGRRVQGRSAYVQSYRDFDEAVTIAEFSAGDPAVDIVGDTAVAVCPFQIVYESGGTTHREQGHDILVFERRGEKWLVVWRTMQTASLEEKND